MLPTIWPASFSTLAVEVSDITTTLPSLLGYGIIGPAMFWAYRTVARSNEESKSEAWEIVERLKAENDRLTQRIDRLTKALEKKTNGGTQPEGKQ